MNRRAAFGIIGTTVAGVTAGVTSHAVAQDKTPQSIADRIVGRRVRVYPDTINNFFLGTVDRVEGSLIYLKDVRVPITEPAHDALIDTRSVRLITVLEKSDK